MNDLTSLIMFAIGSTLDGAYLKRLVIHSLNQQVLPRLLLFVQYQQRVPVCSCDLLVLWPLL